MSMDEVRGKLTLLIEAKLPTAAKFNIDEPTLMSVGAYAGEHDIYRQQMVSVLTVTCTYKEGVRVAERWKRENPKGSAVWEGPVTL